MIIRAKAPLRLGLAGGGTDVSPYCDIYGGAVLNVTINMYAYCTIEPTNDGKIIIDAKDLNEHFESDSKEFLDTLDGKVLLHKGVYNRLVKDYNLENLSFKMTTYSDAPMGCGLGGSSTMVVAILKAFVEWLNLSLGDYDMASLAYKIERSDLKLSGGKQDQYAATFGGFNFMEFHKDKVIIEPLRVKRWIKNELESELVLYFTGKSRKSAEIIDNQIKNTKENNKESINAMHVIKDSAILMKNALLTANFNEMANELNKSWQAKKKMSSAISNKEIDNLYDFVIENGGKAAKISGAGGGGFMMILCNPNEKYSLIEKLKTLNGKVVIPTIDEEGCKAWVIYD